MLEYFRHYKRKAKNIKEIVPVFFYNVGLLFWRMIGCDLFLLKCEIKEKLKNRRKKKDVSNEEISEIIEETEEIIEEEINEAPDREEPRKKLDPDDLMYLLRAHYYQKSIIIPVDVENLDNQKFQLATDDGRTLVVKVTKETDLLGVDLAGVYDVICKYKYQEDGSCKGEILCIVKPEWFSFFSEIMDLEEKSKNIMALCKCSEEQRRLIWNTANASQKAKNSDCLKSVTSKDAGRQVITEPHQLEMMYNLCKETLPVHLQYKAEELIYEMHRGGRKKEEAAMILADILYAFVEDENDNVEELPSYDECVKILKKYRFGDDELIHNIALRIRLLSRCKEKGFVFCLLGEPGTGKTQIGKGIAECLRRRYCEVPCREQKSIDIAGAKRIYEGARHGKVQDCLTRYGNYSVMLLDEYDKMLISDKEGNPYFFFDSVFDDRKVFEDLFTEVPIPVENMVFILTFNSIDTVPEHIKNRFSKNIFYIDKYSNEKKVEIATRFVIPDLMERYNFTDDEIEFTNDGLIEIAKTTSDAGARELAQQLEGLFGTINSKLEDGAQAPVIVNADFVSKELIDRSSPKQTKMGFRLEA